MRDIMQDTEKHIYAEPKRIEKPKEGLGLRDYFLADKICCLTQKKRPRTESNGQPRP